jgi:ribosome-associated translation inhibitor RaiA
MQYLFIAPGLTKPTFETLEFYSKKMFKKIDRLLITPEREPVLRISVAREGNEFIITVELHAFKNIIVKEKDRDLRKAISLASNNLKLTLAKNKEKRNHFKLTEKVQELRNKLLNRDYLE